MKTHAVFAHLHRAYLELDLVPRLDDTIANLYKTAGNASKSGGGDSGGGSSNNESPADPGATGSTAASGDTDTDNTTRHAATPSNGQSDEVQDQVTLDSMMLDGSGWFKDGAVFELIYPSDTTKANKVCCLGASEIASVHCGSPTPCVCCVLSQGRNRVYRTQLAPPAPPPAPMAPAAAAGGTSATTRALAPPTAVTATTSAANHDAVRLVAVKVVDDVEAGEREAKLHQAVQLSKETAQLPRKAKVVQLLKWGAQANGEANGGACYVLVTAFSPCIGLLGDLKLQAAGAAAATLLLKNCVLRFHELLQVSMLLCWAIRAAIVH